MSAATFRVVAVLAVIFIGAPARAESDLARAYRIIAGKDFVDLTHSFGPTTPVWSGFGQARFSPAADPKTHKPYTIADDGFRTTLYEMVGQYGTHVDPPAHFAPDGITMDKIPLKQMILPLIVLDDTPYLGKDPNHAFSVADLKAWEKKHGRVPRGSFVALRTDMSKDWDKDPERFKRAPFPAWALETIKFLYEQRGVTATGHEAEGARRAWLSGTRFCAFAVAPRSLPSLLWGGWRAKRAGWGWRISRSNQPHPRPLPTTRGRGARCADCAAST